MDNQEKAKWILFLLSEPTEANRVLRRHNFNKHREESRSCDKVWTNKRGKKKEIDKKRNSFLQKNDRAKSKSKKPE